MEVKIVLWCNGLAHDTTDVRVWVRILIGLHNGQFGRGGRWVCKIYGVGSIPTLTSTGEGYWIYRPTWSWESGSIPQIAWLSGKELSLIRMAK